MNKILVILFVVLMIVGCGMDNTELVETAVIPAPPTKTVPTPTSRPTPTVTVAPTATVEPTATATPEPTATPTPEPTPNIQQTSAARMPDAIPQDTVAFSSNAMAENTGVLINFQHPRAWQTSYFSDSGSSGWLISDADPNEAFWSAFSTGEESMILILPVYDIADLRELPAESEPILLETNGKTIQYILDDEEFSGRIIQDDIAFQFFGSHPANDTAGFHANLETLLTSFSWDALGDVDLSEVWLLGTRSEGSVARGESVDGYVPMASISEWIFNSEADETITLQVDTYEPMLSLVLDVVDDSGKSILRKGAQEFTGSTEVELVIPTDGTYHIQVTAPTGFNKYGPWNPPAEAKVYGWYKLLVE